MAFLFGMVDGAIAVTHFHGKPHFPSLDMLLTEVNHEGQSGSPA
jgi:hypothetical protein